MLLIFMFLLKEIKLDDKNIKYIFVGYNNETKDFKIYDPIIKKLIIRHDVIFSERKLGIIM